MELIIISNTCVGAEIYKQLNKQYTSPFIGTLIPNDKEYIKLCNNIHYYLNVTPIINQVPKDNTPFAIQNKSKYYKHPAIRIPYPVIHLEDIEIHCIHDNIDNITLKWQRRCERTREIILRNNYLIINSLTMYEFLNNHTDIISVINNYINNKQEKVHNLFIGPLLPALKCENYIVDAAYSTDISHRNSSHVPINNDQDKSGIIFANYIKQKIL